MTVQPPHQPPPEDPHEGSEDDPRRELDPRDEAPVVPPRRYDTREDSAALARPAPSTMDRVAAASMPMAVIAFFLVGFGTGMWHIAWIVFLIPPVLYAWNRPGRR